MTSPQRSSGWSELLGPADIVSANVDSPRRQALLKVTGPGLLAAGLLAAALLQRSDAGTVSVLLWAASLALAGAGIGIAFPHLVVTAMQSADDEKEASQAAAGANTVELTAVALGAAVSGVLVNLGASTLQSAQFLFAGLAAIAALGVLTAARASAPREAVALTPEPLKE